MDRFDYSYPVRVHFGRGIMEDAIRSECQRMGDRVMVAYGGGSVRRTGVLDRVLQVLRDCGKGVVEFPGIMPNPTYSKVQEGARLAVDREVDFILALGGGSVIDCCKIVSAQARTDGDLWDLLYGSGQAPKDGIPMGAVVTVSGTGSEMNNGGVITYEEKSWKGPLFGTLADFAVLDPELTATVPRMQVMSGAFDTLSHAMETYLGNSDADNVSDDVALAIMRNTVVNMRRLLTDIDDMEARGNLMWDSAMAENGILKVGRRTDFQAHQIEHQLGAYTDCNHGQGLAVIHPAYYRRIAGDAEAKFSRMGGVVFGVEGAAAAVDALAAFIEECGLPTRMGQLGSRVEITPELLRKVADSSNIISTNPRRLTNDAIYDLLMECI